LANIKLDSIEPEVHYKAYAGAWIGGALAQSMIACLLNQMVIRTPAEAMGVGVIATAISFAASIIHHGFEGKSLKLVALHETFHLVAFSLGGLITWKCMRLM